MYFVFLRHYPRAQMQLKNTVTELQNARQITSAGGRESVESEEFPGISGGFRMQAATLLQCLTVPPSPLRAPFIGVS